MYYGRPAKNSSSKLFYGLPPIHILNSLCSKIHRSGSPDDHTCLSLLKAVFPDFLRESTKGDAGPALTIKGSTQRIPAMLGTMRELLVRHSKVDYAKLLRHCLDRMREYNHVFTFPSGDDLEGCIKHQEPSSPGIITQALPQSSSSTGPKVSASSVLYSTQPPLLPQLQAVSHSQVCRYVTSVLRHLLSIPMMGSQHNLDVVLSRELDSAAMKSPAQLLSDARRFVGAKQHEPISLHSLTQGLKINDFAWLSMTMGKRVSPQEATKRRQLIGEFIRWLFERYLVPLLKNTFYVTETASTKYETVYYSHDDWEAATKPHFCDLEESLLEPLPESKRSAALTGPLGVSAVRLIPKPTGFRPIVNLGRHLVRSAKGNNGRPMTANQVLRGVHQILTYEKDRNRNLLGSSLFGTNEIFTPLRDLKEGLITKHGKLPKLYFVKTDIKAAFDTIKQEKMMDIVTEILDKNHDYCLMLYCLLLPPPSDASAGAARRLFKSRAIVNDELSANFGDYARDLAKPLRNAVLLELGRRKQVTRESCLELIRVHIEENIIQIGQQLYRQKTGIPQGSKISSLLCSFFYAFLENEHLSFVRRPGSKLLRYIDDFLFVSDDYSLCRRFLETMNKGFASYGAFVSSSKTLLNFDYSTDKQFLPTCEIDLFPYCGYLIDTRSLDLSLDYPRTLLAPVRQSFAVRSSRHVGSTFLGWFSRQLENRNHVAYLDTKHNLKQTVYLNIFLNFALTTMKVPHYFKSCSHLSPHQSTKIFESLCQAIEYTYVAGRARVRHFARGDKREHYTIKMRDFVFLARHAIIKVLSKKVSMFKGVLRMLERDFSGGREDEELLRVIQRGWTAVRDAKY
ncbi:telomerase reverse transcriptase, partial [Tremellales sp. Uapishka_1]